MRLHRICAAVTTAMCLAVPVRADQPAAAFDNSTSWTMAGGVAVYGWQFTTQADIQVSALGLYDNPGIFGGGFLGDGLLETHAIGIWDVSNPGSPVVSGVLAAGTGSTLLSGFRYVGTSPVVLSANHDYVIGALYGNQLLAEQDFVTGEYNNPAFVLTVGPAIAFGGYQYAATNVFSFPGQGLPGTVFAFGPNFTYSVVPEPSSLAIFVFATLAIICGKKRLSRVRQRRQFLL